MILFLHRMASADKLHPVDVYKVLRFVSLPVVSSPRPSLPLSPQLLASLHLSATHSSVDSAFLEDPIPRDSWKLLPWLWFLFTQAVVSSINDPKARWLETAFVISFGGSGICVCPGLPPALSLSQEAVQPRESHGCWQDPFLTGCWTDASVPRDRVPGASASLLSKQRRHGKAVCCELTRMTRHHSRCVRLLEARHRSSPRTRVGAKPLGSGGYGGLPACGIPLGRLRWEPWAGPEAGTSCLCLSWCGHLDAMTDATIEQGIYFK